MLSIRLKQIKQHIYQHCAKDLRDMSNMLKLQINYNAGFFSTNSHGLSSSVVAFTFSCDYFFTIQ